MRQIGVVFAATRVRQRRGVDDDVRSRGIDCPVRRIGVRDVELGQIAAVDDVAGESAHQLAPQLAAIAGDEDAHVFSG